MNNVIGCDNYGGPEVLKCYNVETSQELGPHEVLIRHTAIGVNEIDIKNRTGEEPIEGSPKLLGVEACGVIEKIGAKVGGYTIGDRVVYATAPAGAYCQKRAVHEAYIVQVPDELEDNIVAASFLNGITAHYLVARAFVVSPGMGVLVHAVDTVLGQYIASWAAARGAFVVGTVSDSERKQLALDNGCHKVINYKEEDLLAALLVHTQNLKVNAVYDMIGADTFFKALACLRTFGVMISVDQKSGPIPPIDLNILRAKSLFLTCPTLADYKSHRMELLLTAEEVFASIKDGVLKPNIGASYKLIDAAEAQRALASGQVNGSIILIP